MHYSITDLYFLSELASHILHTNAFNCVVYLPLQSIIIQNWDGTLSVLHQGNKISNADIPDFILPGIMKIVGSTLIISQGNRILGLSITNLLANETPFVNVRLY